MYKKFCLTLVSLLSAASLFLAPAAISHFDDKEMQQSYRQSFFALVAANFGPMAAMLKGDMPYDEEKMKAHAGDLSALMSLDVMRGFGPGSDKGTTRAKPEIWDNMADFEAKMNDLVNAAAELNTAAQTGDKKAIGQKFGAAGQACKACHDDYKSKDYLY